MAMEIDSLTHPNPTPDPYHRKIELQSPQDLTYLQTNLSNSARQKIDLHFPIQRPVSAAPPATVILLDGGTSNQQDNTANPPDQQEPQKEGDEDEDEDPLRRRVRELVDQFMTRTWQYASESISVNGMDATSLLQTTFPPASSTTKSTTSPKQEREGIDFTYAPYDSKLQSKVASLYGELENLTAQVSRLRRTAPEKGAELSREMLEREIQDDQMVHESLRRRIENGVEVEDLRLMSDHNTNWSQDVREMYERGISELRGLGGLTGSNHMGVEAGDVSGGPSLTETVGKVQRARTVAMEFE